MNYYFILQYKRFSRWLDHLGINRILGIVLGLITFFALSKLLFFKLQYAKWIYLAFGILYILKLTDNKRNRTIRSIFPDKNYHQIRLVENSIMALPFLIYLLIELEFLIALLLLLSIPILTIIKTNQYWIRTIPTPFKRSPFEFIIGFRKTFWLIALVYFVILKAIQVHNYYLGLFGLGVIIFTCMSYYQKPEDEYFVWIYNAKPKEFLIQKFYTLLKCAFALSLIPIIALFIAFPSNWWITLLVFCGANIILGSVIVAKYSAYPFEMNLPQGILYSISIIIPLILVITIGVFYKKSHQTLEQYL